MKQPSSRLITSGAAPALDTDVRPRTPDAGPGGPQAVPRLAPDKVSPEETYILGHSQAEIKRLISQAAILRPTTERLLQRAGLRPGMRVLDLGCGAGDVSMLAGQLVGVRGAVVGVDRNTQILEVARARARHDDLQQVAFVEASVDDFSDAAPFDLVIARYVLVHQIDPVGFLRAAALFARDGGILALHEPVLDRPIHCAPAVELWQQTADRIVSMLRAGAPSWDAASRLVEHFVSAGLTQPQLFSETLVGGGFDAPHYAWFADVTRTLLPQMTRAGLGTAEAISIDTLESRLRVAVVAARSQVEGPAQMCAWTSV